jgi:DNA-binding Lrp family transcriptional regulator
VHASKRENTMKFDKYEWQILQELQKNGRLSNQEIADRIGLSATPCWRRINELNNSGVIKHYAAILDAKKINIGETAFAHVTIAKHENSSRDFEGAIVLRDEVLECYASMGEADYLLKLAIPDVAAYDHFLQRVLFKIPAVIDVRSNFALRVIKQQTALPLSVYDSHQNSANQ